MMVLSANADDSSLIQLGTYIQFGQYNEEPILWKCVSTDDENGKLILSDKIICLKAYDSCRMPAYSLTGSDTDLNGEAFWERSSIRAWLNTTTPGSEIVWPNNNPPNVEFGIGPFLPYADENGFLTNNNFSEAEKNIMKSVSQWQILGYDYKELSTNGIRECFQTDIEKDSGKINRWLYRDVSLLGHIKGAMYRVTDTMFLIDEFQLYKLWENFGTVAAQQTEFAKATDDEHLYEDNRYWLRDSSYLSKYAYGKSGYDRYTSAYAYGIRPAFYLNEENMIIKSGSGTEEDPYIVTGIEQVETPVFCNGEQVRFDQQPIEENDRLLVPVRAVFESLGAEVTYDDSDGVITANNGERTVVMQIDNLEMGNGTEVFTLDVAPKIINDRTVVPLRAVSEAFDCTVDYIENLNRVVLDKPTKQVFDDYVGSEYWQQDWYIEKYGDWRPLN